MDQITPDALSRSLSTIGSRRRGSLPSSRPRLTFRGTTDVEAAKTRQQYKKIDDRQAVKGRSEKPKSSRWP